MENIINDDEAKQGIGLGQKIKIKISHSRYTWEDKEYRDLMFDLLSNLEPISYKKDEILFDELDEFNSVIYIMNK